jgi:PAS domain S-box-containing protein
MCPRLRRLREGAYACTFVSTSMPMRTGARVALAATAYFASARLGYALAIPHGIVTLWPPSGVMLGLLLLNARRDWPALLAGGFIGSVLSDRLTAFPLPLALFAAFANGLETLVAAWFLRWRLGERITLTTQRAALDLVAGAGIVTNAVTSFVGAIVLLIHAHILHIDRSFGAAWLIWWAGDGLGILIVTPMMLAWAETARRRPRITPAVVIEAVGMLLTLLVVSEIALGPRQDWVVQPGPYITFPALFWAALRFGPAGAATASFVVATVATWNAALGVGPFNGPSVPSLETAAQVYAFLAIAILSSLIPAVVLEERKAAGERLSESEKRFRFALEASRVGVWELDFATGAATWSGTLERLHGLEPGAFAGTYGAFFERIHPADRQQVRDEMDRATRERSDSKLSYRTTWPDGSTRWMSGVGRTFYDDRGAPVRAAGIIMDATDQRALEERYRQSQKMEAVGQLAGGVAHDFNNLLTGIQAYASILEEELPPESEQHHDVREILRAAERGASLTRQLLAFSRRQILAPRVVDLRASLESLQPMLRRVIGEHIELSVRAPDDVWPVVADPSQIEQMILNLSLNAGDAMPEGGMLMFELENVEITAPEGESADLVPGEYVQLLVSDSGVGMDRDVAARIFEPFFTTKPQGKGTGLGLSTVYGAVTQSGGRIRVYSEPGHGTTFKIHLPRARVTSDEHAAARRDDAPATGGTETILVTEDDSVVRGLVRRALETRGYAVFDAATPHEAIQIAARNPGRIDLLLTDVVLPEMSGRALAEDLTTRWPSMRVVYMSGYTDDAVVRRGVLAREAQFIQKPFGHEDLLRKVRETLDKPVHVS